MEVMQMKCRICGRGTSEFSDGYCLRCEKIAADIDAELAIGFETTEEVGHYIRCSHKHNNQGVSEIARMQEHSDSH
jgi:hypothetical protein